MRRLVVSLGVFALGCSTAYAYGDFQISQVGNMQPSGLVSVAFLPQVKAAALPPGPEPSFEAAQIGSVFIDQIGGADPLSFQGIVNAARLEQTGSMAMTYDSPGPALAAVVPNDKGGMNPQVAAVQQAISEKLMDSRDALVPAFKALQAASLPQVEMAQYSGNQIGSFDSHTATAYEQASMAQLEKASSVAPIQSSAASSYNVDYNVTAKAGAESYSQIVQWGATAVAATAVQQETASLANIQKSGVTYGSDAQVMQLGAATTISGSTGLTQGAQAGYGTSYDSLKSTDTSKIDITQSGSNTDAVVVQTRDSVASIPVVINQKN